jgi:hypothetical protein
MEETTISQNCQISEDGLVEVDVARVFKEAIVGSKVLNFKEDLLRQKILNAESDQLLVVRSTINSPKIVQSVDYYDEEFLENSL